MIPKKRARWNQSNQSKLIYEPRPKFVDQNSILGTIKLNILDQWYCSKVFVVAWWFCGDHGKAKIHQQSSLSYRHAKYF